MALIDRPINEAAIKEPGVLRPEEFHVVAHLRQWCHNGAECAICKAEARAFEAERRFESVVSGD